MDVNGAIMGARAEFAQRIVTFLVPAFYALVVWVGSSHITDSNNNDRHHNERLKTLEAGFERLAARSQWNSDELRVRREAIESIKVLQSEIATNRRLLEDIQRQLRGK